MWLLFLLLFLYFNLVPAQFCSNGVKVFSRFPGRSIDGNETKSSGVLLQEPGPGITLDCIKLCDEQPTCSSFNLEYTKTKCVSFSDIELEQIKIYAGSSFFQKGCYQNVSKEFLDSTCGRRAWTFDVIVDASLEGFAASIVSQVESRQDCEQLCMKSEEIECKSANYFPALKECGISRETRRSQPQAFRTGYNSSIYLENQCVPPRPSPCRYHKTQDTKLLAIDSLVFAKDDADCQKMCDSNQDFICRSYSLQETKCHLSGHDSFTRHPSDVVSSSGSVIGDVVCPSDECVRGTWTYEIVPDHTLSGSDQSPFDDTGNDHLPHNSNDCRSACDRKGFLCPSFTINHQQNGNCYNLDRNSQGRSNRLVSSNNQAYFEKVCLKLPNGELNSTDRPNCKAKLWSFTRIPAHQLDMDKYNITLHLISSRRDCEQKCLDSNYNSALYDEMSVTCKLSKETRFTARLNKNFNPKISYLENNCLFEKNNNQSCEWKETHRTVSQIKDMEVINVTSKDTCRQLCDENNKFRCLSFSYNQEEENCILSSETRKTSTLNITTSKGGNWTFYELKCDGDQSTESTNIVTHSEEQPLPITTEVPQNYSLCRSDSDTTFERIPGFEPFGNLYLVRLCHGTADNPGIVKSCKNLCLGQTNCRGFVVDYSKKHCIGVISQTAIERSSLKVSEEKDFFRVDCLPKVLSCPNKIWSFERVIDQTINPAYPPRYILPFISRPACQCLCLEERKFTCRSIVHETRGNVCKMYDRDRGWNDSPIFSLMFSQGSEYLENSCTDTMTPHDQVCRYSIHRDDVTIRSLIHSHQVVSMSECRRTCDSELSFRCRSFSFVDRMLYSLHSKNLCLLSSDNEWTSRENSLRFSPRSFYYQRDCRTV